MYQIIDTNVLLVASKKAPQASESCELTCEKHLQGLMNTGILVIDSQWLIIKEYMNKNSQSGQPNAGDKFLKWVLLNHTNPNRCEKVSITQIAENDFVEFPRSPSLEKFDPSDRKFVAAALTHHAKPAIANAEDRGWRRNEQALVEHGIKLNFLCPKTFPKA